MSLTPPDWTLREAFAVTDTTFDQVHDAHVQAVLEALADHRIEPATAETALDAMITIAEAEHYGENQ